MEPLENNGSINKELISQQINKSVNKTINELRKLTNKSNDISPEQIDSILAQYINLLRTGACFNGTQVGGREYWILLTLIVLARLTAIQTSKLLCIIGISFYQTLINTSTFRTINDLLNHSSNFVKLEEFLNKFSQSNIEMILTLDNINYILDLIDDPSPCIVSMCSKFANLVVLEFSKISHPLEELQRLSNKISNTTQDNVIRSLESTVNNLLDDERQDITTLILFNSGMIDFINEIKASSYTIKTYCQIIRYVTFERLAVIFHGTLISTCRTVVPKSKIYMSFTSLNVCNKNIDISFKFLLEVLNHENDIFDTSHKMNLIYASRCMHYIISYTCLKYGKFNIFTMFNNLHPKKSIMDVFYDFNLKMIQILLEKENIIVPDIINMKSNKLPPFPKEPFLLDLYENDKPSALELDIDNFKSLVYQCLIKSLQLISMFSGDEFHATEREESDLTAKVMIYKFQKLLNLLLLNGLIFGQFDFVAGEIGYNYILTAIRSSLDQTNKYKSLIWTLVINHCHKVTSNELRLVEIVRNILCGLLSHYKGDSILQDQLVKNEILELVSVIGYDNIKQTAILDYTGIIPDNSIILINAEALESFNDKKQQTDQSETISTNFSSLSLKEDNYNESTLQTQSMISHFDSKSELNNVDQLQMETSNSHNVGGSQFESPLSQFSHIFDSPHYSNYTANWNQKLNYSNLQSSGEGFNM